MWEGCNCICLAWCGRCPKVTLSSSILSRCRDGTARPSAAGRGEQPSSFHWWDPPLKGTHHSHTLRGPEWHNQIQPQSENASRAWKAILPPLGDLRWCPGKEPSAGARCPPTSLAAGRDSHQMFRALLLPPHFPFPYQHKGTGPSSLGRKYHFYLCTRKLWVALYETKNHFFFFHLH